MNRQQKHSDIDSELLPMPDPMQTFWTMGCLASGLSVVSSWLVLVGLMAAGALPWLAWPYVALPITIWLVLLALPAFWISRRAGLAILEAIATTAEAWLARAGYSIDLNGDGYIGRQTNSVTITPPAMVRPLIVSSAAQGLRLLASDSPAAFDAPGLGQVVATPAPPPPKQWELPNGATVPESTLEKFIKGIFIKGLARGVWAGPDLLMERDQYEGCMALLESAGLLTGRRSGYSGRLTLDTAQQVREVLGLGQGGKDD